MTNKNTVIALSLPDTLLSQLKSIAESNKVRYESLIGDVLEGYVGNHPGITKVALPHSETLLVEDPPKGVRCAWPGCMEPHGGILQDGPRKGQLLRDPYCCGAHIRNHLNECELLRYRIVTENETLWALGGSLLNGIPVGEVTPRLLPIPLWSKGDLVQANEAHEFAEILEVYKV